MLALNELQKQFQLLLIKDDPKFISQVNSTAKAPAETRLKIYSDAYVSRLEEVLEKDYPSLHTLLGDAQFSELAKKYIQTYPSHYRSVRWFGENMPVFLSNTSAYTALPALREMADFEWTIAKSFDCVNESTCSLQTLQTIPAEQWPELQLIFAKSFYLLRFHWNIPIVWKYIQAEETFELQRQEKDVGWIIWRKGFEVLFRSVDVVESAAIQAVLQKKSFADLCEVVCEHVGEERTPTTTMNFINTWLGDEIVVDIAR